MYGLFCDSIDTGMYHLHLQCTRRMEYSILERDAQHVCPLKKWSETTTMTRELELLPHTSSQPPTLPLAFFERKLPRRLLPEDTKTVLALQTLFVQHRLLLYEVVPIVLRMAAD